jgi:hypothetical protein
MSGIPQNQEQKDSYAFIAFLQARIAFAAFQIVPTEVGIRLSFTIQLRNNDRDEACGLIG